MSLAWTENKKTEAEVVPNFSVSPLKARKDAESTSLALLYHTNFTVEHKSLCEVIDEDADYRSPLQFGNK